MCCVAFVCGCHVCHGLQVQFCGEPECAFVLVKRHYAPVIEKIFDMIIIIRMVCPIHLFIQAEAGVVLVSLEANATPTRPTQRC